MTSEKTVVGHSNEDQLIETYRPRVLYFALRRLRDRGLAEEIAQETVAAAVMALRENRLREPEKLPAFVFATARHLVQNAQREQARELAHTTDSNSIGSESWKRDPDAALILEEQRVQVRRLSNGSALAIGNSFDKFILKVKLWRQLLKTSASKTPPSASANPAHSSGFDKFLWGCHKKRINDT